jgi:hypothetical protein
MQRRGLRWGLAGLAAALGVVAAFLAIWAAVLWVQTGRLTAESCEQLRLCHTRADVEDLLGVPPGDYRARASDPYYDNLVAEWQSDLLLRYLDATAETWRSDDVVVVVYCDRSGKVLYEYHLRVAGPKLSLQDWLRGRAKQIWQRLSR